MRESSAIAEQLNASDQEGHLLFQTIFSVCPAPIAITREGTGEFVDVNEQFCRLVSYRREDILGQTASALGLWADLERRRELGRLMQESDSVQDFEVLVRRSDQSICTALGSFQRITIGGQPCYLIVLTDITERKRWEQELIEAKDRAEEMARVKTAFITNMTHEVRTPLTVILGFTSVLRQGGPREHHRFVRAIERSGRRLLLMLDNILDLAQLEAGTVEIDREPFNLIDLLTNVLQQVRPLVEEKGLGLDLGYNDTALYVRSGHRIVLRVLNNVFDNAVKFTQEGSIHVDVQKVEDWAEINIRDTGIGIEQDFLSQAFEEFSQESTGLERTHQGSGLGLTVSRRLLEVIGGTVVLESRKGKGSKVTIRLPLAE